MEHELEVEKVKRALFALMDLRQSRIYDYYSTSHDGEMKMSQNYGFNDHEINEMIYAFEKFITKNNL